MKKFSLRSRQKTLLTFRVKLIVGASVFIAVSVMLIVFFNIGDVKDSKAFSSGDYRTISSGNWDDIDVWEVFDGQNWKPASLSPVAGHLSIVVSTGQRIVLTDEISVNSIIIEKEASLEIEANLLKVFKKGGKGGVFCYGELAMGSVIIDGDGDFVVGPEATLMIGSDLGINKKIKKGNVQLKGKLDFNRDAFYVFNGTVRQHTGTGLPSTLRNFIVENRSGVEMDQSFTVTGYLGLRKGVLYTLGNQLSLGSSHNEPATIDYLEGAMSGKIRCWFGQKNFEKLEFPLSDGSTISNFTFQPEHKDFQRGLLEFSYQSGIPDDSKKSPFDARQVVIGIMSNGFFSVKTTNGADESWLRFVNVKVEENNRRNYIWAISKRAMKSQNSVNSQQSETVSSRQMSFSNMIYGPQPFNDKVIFRFYSESPSVSYIQLIDSNGRMVFNKKVDVFEGYNQSEIQIDPTLPDGNYILQISNASEIQTLKVVKGSRAGSDLTLTK